MAGVDPQTAGTGTSNFFTLCGGDQLTVERSIGAQLICSSSASRSGRLEELVPCCENWHMGMVFLTLCYDHLYSAKSQGDVGTMFHLHQAIDRRNVSSDVKHHYHECADFFCCVVESHIVAAGRKFFGVADSGSPTCHVPPSRNVSHIELAQRTFRNGR